MLKSFLGAVAALVVLSTSAIASMDFQVTDFERRLLETMTDIDAGNDGLKTRNGGCVDVACWFDVGKRLNFRATADKGQPVFEMRVTLRATDPDEQALLAFLFGCVSILKLAESSLADEVALAVAQDVAYSLKREIEIQRPGYRLLGSYYREHRDCIVQRE